MVVGTFMKLDLYTKNILVVDDNKSNVLLLKALLEDLGYKSIFAASSAKEAYEILENNLIDLVLLDVMMPVIDGHEATVTIRKNDKYNHLHIIMVTADNSDETIEKCFDSGADDYISKPVHPTMLKVRVQSALMSAYREAIISNENRLLAADETVHMLAHQWRQPLALISATLIDITLSYEFKELNQEKLDEATFKINDAVHSLSSTLDEFCKISKNTSEASLLKLRNTVSTSKNLLKDRFEANNIEVITEFLDTQEIRYFHNEIVKTLLAVYNNSIEAFERSSKKEDKLIVIKTNQTSEASFITIMDNAGGVDAKILPKVFEPYVSIKDEKNGVGLGLYNAFNTLKSMKGSITISSDGPKTTVSIKLPNS